MIERLKLTNFKCFEKLDLELSNLNVLAGINSMGKSTVVQALLLLRQAYELGSISEGLHLNGDIANIGVGYDILYRASEKDEFSIEIDIDCTKNMWRYKYNRNSDFQELIESIFNKEFTDINLFCSSFSYVSADRLGPQRVYNKSYHQVIDKNQVGYRGELFADFLSERGKDYKIHNINVLNKSTKSQILLYQLEAWLSEISPSISLNTKAYTEAGLVGLTFSKEGYTPLNVGFGLSYVAPIVISILKAQKNDLLIIENPEAHLHPKGQRKMGELIAAACAGGVQIILETHSDHLLNGIRLSVKNKIIDRNNIRLNYFFIEQNEKSFFHSKCSPAILEDGSLSSWPDGFFDEWDKAIDELF